jgi:hypothetical protein
LGGAFDLDVDASLKQFSSDHLNHSNPNQHTIPPQHPQMDGLEDALARAREAVRALASASSGEGGAAARAKEASRLLREVERAVEVSELAIDRWMTPKWSHTLNRRTPISSLTQYAQRAAAGEAGSESERALALSRLQQVSLRSID